MELWDVYDRQGNVTGKTITRGGVLLGGEYHLGASLWVVNKNGELLIQKRAMTKRIKPGVWSITGGAALAGESSVNACAREVAEEIGLAVNPQDIKLLSRSFGKDCIYDDYIIIYDFPLADLVLQKDEVSEVMWANVEKVRNLYNNGLFMLNDISELEKVMNFINKNNEGGRV